MTEKCKHCGVIHETRCPCIKSIEYFEDGTIKRIEYLTSADYWPVTYPVYVPTIPVYQYPYHRPQPLYPYSASSVTANSTNSILS